MTNAKIGEVHKALKMWKSEIEKDMRYLAKKYNAQKTDEGKSMYLEAHKKCAETLLKAVEADDLLMRYDYVPRILTERRTK